MGLVELTQPIDILVDFLAIFPTIAPMKKYLILFMTLILCFMTFSVHAAWDEEGGQQAGTVYDDTPEQKRSGWFIGSDQGVLFFVGDSDKVLNAQYYGSLFGGYSLKGWVEPYFSLGQAIGSLSGFNVTTFFFIFEGGARFYPIRTKIRPFLTGTAGLYVLDFSNFNGVLISNGANFTYSGGGGLTVTFGRSNLDLKGVFRGFNNTGGTLQSVAVTLGYFFQF